MRADSRHRSLEDLCSLGRPMTHSATGAGTTSTVTATLAHDMIGGPHRGVTGYKGSTEAVVALLRGEVDATVKTLQALGKYARAGQVRILMTFEDSPSLEGVPAYGALGDPDFARFRMQRMIGGPPGIPAEIRARLTEALMAAATAPEVQDWSVRAGYPLDPIPGPEAVAMMDVLMGFYGANRDMPGR